MKATKKIMATANGAVILFCLIEAVSKEKTPLEHLPLPRYALKNFSPEPILAEERTQ